ncbi:cysteinyl-tRNA synthetase [Dacryopinax primogenitus]|uniref:cysteine--tRNA ligase n=1 Tax=Dacryopinax primogenitus (strain DJM 731) TaxID=1858805 RepID=M5FPX7_DACPD|nr:cysteinyl-tRNA synthetase [Dacryopinax primogenitus]EJT98845.1 cysteinyl-tRNA synthetase [Dacryopinax primogenitus]
MADTKVRQAEWIRPTPIVEEPRLKIYNSLTREKTEFIPIRGRQVKWYNCGPTVYEASHMGHARNYVTQDILRRILSDYFGYDVFFVMNITDIDDKIIIRSRQNYLLEQLKAKSTSLTTSLIAEVREAWQQYRSGKLATVPNPAETAWPDIFQQFTARDPWALQALQQDEKVSMHMAALQSAYAGLEQADKVIKRNDTTPSNATELIEAARDVLSLYLDKLHGSSVTDPAIPRAHAAHWEDQFLKDMDRLRVMPPDALTRVTDYVQEIAIFVQRVVKRGWAYEAGSSVWFDTAAFDHAKTQRPDDWEHVYAKLEPWSKNNKKLLEEGEGSLTSTSGKRSASDFALWKASKPGEPSWPSPWGPGRPGWHIECSVMASEVLGEQMDLHSGGIDLAFPHHDNEMAQSEAYHDCRQWVNYFLHTGHLHIEGLKMSKSLKNFITIDDALRVNTARQLRLTFLLQPWNGKMDYKEALVQEARSVETAINNFFTLIKALIAESNVALTAGDRGHGYHEEEKELVAQLQTAQHEFRVALCDSFNTQAAMATIQDIISKTNIYYSKKKSAANISVMRVVALWGTKMLRMFGLGEGNQAGPGGGIGWGEAATGEVDNVDRDSLLMPYLRVLSTFRDDVRKTAIGHGTPKDFLTLCDKLRDEDLVPLGVALDDQEGDRALVKLVNPEILMRARDEKAAAAAEKKRAKAAQQEAQRQQRIAKLERGRLAPNEMFKPPHVPEGTYGSWDEEGLPLTEGEGQELSKNKVKTNKKRWDEQKKMHEEWKKWQEEEGGRA